MTLLQLRQIAADSTIVIEQGRTKLLIRPNSEESKALFHLIRCLNSGYRLNDEDVRLLKIGKRDNPPREQVKDVEPVAPSRVSLIEVDE